MPLRVYLNDSWFMRIAQEKYEPFVLNNTKANIVHDLNLKRFMTMDCFEPFLKEGASNRMILGTPITLLL